MGIFGADSDRGLVGPLLGLALIAPDVAVTIRRLHDLDRKWPWFLIVFTGIGAIVLLVWFCFRGTTGPNRFADDPLAPESAAPSSATSGVPT